MDGPVFYIGHHQAAPRGPISDRTLVEARNGMYDMFTVPITTPAYHERVTAALGGFQKTNGQPATSDDAASFILEPLTKEDTDLTPGELLPQLIVTASNWIDLASPDPLMATASLQILQQELAYASFCGATNVLIDAPFSRLAPNQEGVMQFARGVQEALRLAPYMQVHIRLPILYSHHVPEERPLASISGPDVDPSVQDADEDSALETTSDLSSWETWHLIRSFNNYNTRLSVDLIFTPQLPRLEVQARWFSEPVRILEITGKSFVANKHGTLVLPKTHQVFLARMTRLRIVPWLLLSDVGPISAAYTGPSASAPADQFDNQDPTPAEAAQTQVVSKQKNVLPYIEYIRRHVQMNLPPRTPMEKFGGGFQDYLQNPLQPLSDNLESITYEVFEKDPIKYDWYEDAIAQALTDWIAYKKPISARSGRVVVAIVGAGRGPIVTRALAAADVAEVPIDIWAIEKNPQAFVLLQRANREKWQGRVNLVHTDMRLWPGPTSSGHAETGLASASSSLLPDGSADEPRTTIDIVVSELLGSFGDNELSPECLDGVQHLLTPQYGISIPSSYTAHVTPIGAPKLHADIRARVASNDKDAWQVPYVVMLHSVDFLSKSTQQPAEDTDKAPNVKLAWEFTHPISPEQIRRSRMLDALGGNAHNVRTSMMKFPCRDRGVCHGLAGYFETVLYASPGAGVIDENGEGEEEEAVIELSTNPVTMDAKSKDMISWFPIFFPLKTPLYVPENSELHVTMWRQTDGRKVWYEWVVESFVRLKAGGVSQLVRLAASELHSSFDNGCLM